MSKTIEQEVTDVLKSVHSKNRAIFYGDYLGYPDEDNRRETTDRDDLWAISTEEIEVIRRFLELRGDFKEELKGGEQ